jgi:hypothetical protein
MINVLFDHSFPASVKNLMMARIMGRLRLRQRCWRLRQIVGVKLGETTIELPASETARGKSPTAMVFQMCAGKGFAGGSADFSFESCSFNDP